MRENCVVGLVRNYHLDPDGTSYFNVLKKPKNRSAKTKVEWKGCLNKNKSSNNFLCTSI